jgi:hypothetical protein
VGRVVALVGDLMDRSRLTAAIPQLEVVGEPGAVAGAAVIVVDLARHGDAVSELRRFAPTARIVAYGPHVDEDGLAAATRAGADLVLPRSRFFRDPAAALDLPATP